ncbi:uncharacterized protein [Epargyreus clarus]|uniref:uncharacterized protein n=1 Tax=Epargyreus clarus TaxID=520877 RepID=UPI003C2F2776
MKSSKLKTALYLVLFISINFSVNGYPIINFDSNLVNKEEKRYPNGTVIGKYTYTDVEGNPIHVKYYADDASYGVELKSMKVVNSNSDLLQSEAQSKFPLQVTDDPFESALDPFTAFEDLTIDNKKLANDPLQHKDTDKGTHKSDNVEYEVFSQNELKAPDKCGKEKVKVYFDKDKRKTRNAKNYDTLEYCERF